MFASRNIRTHLMITVALASLGAGTAAQGQSNERLISGEWVDPDPRIAAQAWQRQRPPLITEAVDIAVSVTLAASDGQARQIDLNSNLSISNDHVLNVASAFRIGTSLRAGGDVNIMTGGVLALGGALDIGFYGQGKVVVSEGQLLLPMTGGSAARAGQIQVAGGILANATGTEVFENLRNNPNYRAPNADGTLEVTDEGKLTASSLRVGQAYVVSLAGFAASNQQFLGGNGTLIIKNGGTVDVMSAAIDRNSSATVSSGGNWKIGRLLTTIGAVTIESGGSIMVARGDTDPAGSVLVTTARANSQNAESTGVLTIDGGGSLLSVKGTVQIQPREGPADQLIISRGGALRADVLLLDRNARTLLTQSGSVRADVSLDILPGLPNSLLSIASGSTVLAPSVFLAVQTREPGEIATIKVSGNGSSLVATNALHIGRSNASGRVIVDDGAVVGSPVVWIGQSAPLVNPTLIDGGSGKVAVAGPRSRLFATSELVIGGAGDGTLRVADGSTVEAHVVYLGREPANPRQPVSPQGTLIIGGGLDLADLDQAAGELDIETDINIGPSGQIIFNHTNAYSFDETVESDAFNTGVIEARKGSTSLDGDMDRFTGNIIVSGGRLDVNTENGAATATVGTGGTLGGRGILAGLVTIAEGGTLAGGQGAGTLEMQTLALADGANLDVALTGALTPVPIFNVRGDVTLDGVINIAAPLDLGRGIYRIVNYGGALIDRGLAIGTVSDAVSDSNFSVFLGAQGQVNLNYLGGGDTGVQTLAGDGGGNVILGGGGWSDDGGRGAELAAGDFLVLTGPMTTLNLSDDGGALDLSGFQFARNGIVLNGDAITLSSPAVPFRVGDGTADGAVFTATVDAPLIGTGGLEKSDLGTLTLRNSNTFSGGTTISGGILRVENDASLGATGSGLALNGGALQANGNLTSARAITIGMGGGGIDTGANGWSLTGLLSGNGTLTKSGVGTLAFSGDGSGLAGQFNIAAGELANSGNIGGAVLLASGAKLSNLASGLIGAGVTGSGGTEVVSNFGTIDGAILLGGGSDSLTNSGTIGGAIDLGEGDDVLMNTGALIGAVALGAGVDRFTIRSGATNGLVSGGVDVDTLILQIGGSDIAPETLDVSRFTGFERLRQEGGTGSVGGTFSFDSIEVATGRLIGQTGSAITAGTISVAAGATFGSAGSVVGNIANSGSLAPGASPGTMAVTGNISFASGSSATFELTPVVSDQIVVTGAVTIGSGTTLNLTGTRPLTPGAPLDLITAAGGITGSFATVTRSPTIFGFVRQQGNAIQLLGLFPTSTSFGSQVNAGITYLNGVLQANQAGPALVAALPTLLNAQGGANATAFASIAPEPYASASQIGVENGLALGAALRGREAQPTGENSGLYSYATGFGNWRRLSGDDSLGTNRANVGSHGALGGIGLGSRAASVSAFIGYLGAGQTIGRLGARNEANGVVAGVTGSIERGNFRASATIAYDGSSADTRRASPDNSVANAHYRLRSWVGDASAAYQLALGDDWSVEPQLGLSYVSTRRGGATERGASAFNLMVDGKRSKATFADASLTLRGGTAAGSTVRPSASIGLRHQFDGRASAASARFVGVPNSFSVSGVTRKETLATVGLGAEADIAKGATVFVGYRGEVGDYGSNNASAGLRMKW